MFSLAEHQYKQRCAGRSVNVGNKRCAPFDISRSSPVWLRRLLWEQDTESSNLSCETMFIIPRKERHLTLWYALGIIYINKAPRCAAYALCHKQGSPVGWGGTKLRPETEACEERHATSSVFASPFSYLLEVIWFLFQAITKWRIEIRGSRHLSRLVRLR